MTATVKNKVRVVLKAGTGFFDMNKPADFQMPAYVTAIRAAGYILNYDMYVPLDEIQSIFLWAADAPPKPGEGVLVSMDAVGNA